MLISLFRIGESGGSEGFLGLCFGFPDGADAVGSDVALADADTNFLEEGGGRFAASKGPDEIVGESLLEAVDVDDDGVLAELDGIGIEQHGELAFAREFFDALGVAILDAREGSLAVGNGDLVANLAGQAHGGFDGRITTADDEDFLVDVVIRFHEAIHDFGKFFTLDAQLAGAAGLSDREDDVASVV